MRRNFLKYLSLTIFSSFILPLNSLLANTKKIINKNLTKKQKWIHLNCVFEEKFNKLLNEKNYKCPICGEYLKQSSL